MVNDPRTNKISDFPPQSPAARDLSTILWPAISGFVGTEITSEMLGIFVVSNNSLFDYLKSIFL